jgi:quercetin dioxygenase-like cupin family protein
MKHRRLTVAAGIVMAVAAAGGLQNLRAQVPGFKRVELQRQDLGVPGRELVMARGEFNPGAGVPRHTHPGEEAAYVLEGEITIEIEGKPPVTYKAGDAFFVPAKTVHTAKNAGKAPTRVLSTYVIEKGKPLATMVK